MTLLLWGGVLLIGGCGSVLRFVVDGAVGNWVGRDFPFGTLVVNVTGAFALGVLVGVALTRDATLLVDTAAIGSYTTFSTWILEAQRLDEERQHRAALANILVGLAVGLAAAALGRWIGAQA